MRIASQILPIFTTLTVSPDAYESYFYSTQPIKKFNELTMYSVESLRFRQGKTSEKSRAYKAYVSGFESKF